MNTLFYEHEADKNDYFQTWNFSLNTTPPHFHKSLELIYCVDGTMNVFIDKCHYSLQKDEMCFIPSYIVHSNEYTDEKNKIHSFLFAHNYFHDFEKTFPQKTLPYLLTDRSGNRAVYDALMRIFEIYGSYGYDGENIPFLQRQALIDELLLELAEIYPPIPVTHAKANDSVIEILNYINRNYKTNLSLSTIAEQFHYSPKYFSDYFKRNVGCNLTEYIHNLRIKNVLMQMQSPDNRQSVTALAYENGFNSLATFYRVLKQYENRQ